MEKKQAILQENFAEYMEEGEFVLNKSRYNSAVVLFFKAINAAIDLILLKKEGTVPSSHSNRFNIVQEKYPELYSILDKDFPYYQESYTSKMNKDKAELLKKDAERLKRMLEE